MFFGSERQDIFGKSTEEYDALIRLKQQQGRFHSLKPEGWRPG